MTMRSLSLRIVLLITIHSCNILTHPIKRELPNYNGLFNNEDEKARAQSSKILGRDLAIPGVHSKDKILLPLKYHFDERLADGEWLDNHINIANLPDVKQPYQNYKVLVVTAPGGLELAEDDKPMTVYIVFNDVNNYQSPMDLPAVYFVKKTLNRNNKNLDPIFLVDSNRTVTGLRSKEIQKFVKFRNKFNSRRLNRKVDDTNDVEELDENSGPTPSDSSTVPNKKN